MAFQMGRAMRWGKERMSRLKRWLVPLAMMLASLAGTIALILDPSCHFSGNESCEFDFSYVFKHFDGKGSGLQFFATGFLASAAVFAWVPLKHSVAKCHGRIVAICIQVCFVAGYTSLLLGLWIDLGKEAPRVQTALLVWLVALPIFALMNAVSFANVFFWIYQLARLLRYLGRVIKLPRRSCGGGFQVFRRQYRVASAGNSGPRASGNDENEAVGHLPK